ncbi:ATPase [Bacillus sp. MUM 116]|uniref:SRPBCC family protein n=1 Tax=Bacillus sp. MUM 116 TaxID=1678002 RepID=UPI0008F5590B|nr:SRPBCC family protein [Bacillus sp. MUM 116]OIK15754.1 ATPase [Bacillus sp. MUM 116]
MVDVLTEITIRSPIKNVAEYAANPDHAPEWYANIKSVKWQTPTPLTIGSKIAYKAQFLGRELAYVYEVVDYIAEQKLIMKTADGPFPMETTYTWESNENNGTRMTLRNRGNPTGFSKWFTPFMGLMMKKANNKDLKKIKEILESSG